MHYIVMLGAPGSGKGTQAELLGKKLHIPHISTGDILRNDPHLPADIKAIITSGGLIPDETMTEIVRNRLKRENKGWILDGYPRTLDQAKELDSMAPGRIKVLYLKISDHEIEDRLSKRRTCSECGAVYHLTSNPPRQAMICDRCQGTLTQREDDRSEVIARRLKVYHQKTSPLIAYFSEKGMLIEVNGGGESNSPQDVHHTVLAAIMQH